MDQAARRGCAILGGFQAVTRQSPEQPGPTPQLSLLQAGGGKGSQERGNSPGIQHNWALVPVPPTVALITHFDHPVFCNPMQQHF